jgi:ubiquinone/menaquinone biosynthesis C-methylase UbiE
MLGQTIIPFRSSLENYYAARAPEYDAVYLKPERQSDLRAIEQWVAQRFAGASVLEIACGTGYWTQFIARTAREVCALDAVAETIEIAKSRVSMGNVAFVIGDAYAPPRGPGGFDAAFAGFWFSHVPRARQREFLSTLRAVLAVDAEVVILDNRFIEGSSSPIAEQDADGNTYQIRSLRDGTTHRVLKNFPTEAELQSLAGGVGGEVRFTQWNYYWAIEFVANRP